MQRIGIARFLLRTRQLKIDHSLFSGLLRTTRVFQCDKILFDRQQCLILTFLAAEALYSSQQLGLEGLDLLLAVRIVVIDFNLDLLTWTVG